MTHSAYLSRFRLDGKQAVVTGALGILGRHFCAALAEAGAAVAVVDLDSSAASHFAVELRQRYKVPVIGVGCDVTDPVSVQQMVDKVVAEQGAIHILHNNAATKGRDVRAFFDSFEDYDLKVWREVMGVNIDGMFLVAQAVGRQMVAQAVGGSIVQTSSIYGIVAPDQRIYEGSHYLGGSINTPAVYSTSKAAVIGLTKHLATYWAPHGIRVNCLVPGGVESGQNQTFTDLYSRRVPLSRMAAPEEIAAAMLFLASDMASYITGQTLAVDGGLTAW